MTQRFFNSDVGTFSVSASLSSANSFTEPAEFDQRRPFNVSVSGTFSATVALQRSFNEGTTWHDVWTTTSPSEKLADTSESGVLWRLGVRLGDYTSGTVVARMSQ